MTSNEIARRIDHTALKPETAEAHVVVLCGEAHRHRFAAVCVMPYYVRLARRLLAEAGSDTAVCAAIGFPIGAHMTLIKVAEAEQAIADGAAEIDMVINVGALKSGRAGVVEEDIRAVADAIHMQGALLKVILETSLLTDDEKRRACELASQAGADFVKTSTGFFGGGATVEDVRLIRRCAASSVRVKASGGIRDLATAVAMIEAGADRIGTSSGIAIVTAAGASS